MATVTLLGSTVDTNTGTHTVVVTPNVGDFIVILSYNSGAGAALAQPAPTDNNPGGAGAYTSVVFGNSAGAAGRVYMHSRQTLVQSGASTTFTQTAAGTSTGGGLVVLAIRGTTQLTARGSGAVSNVASPVAPVLSGGAPLLSSVIITGHLASAGAAVARAGYTSHVNTSYATPTTFYSAQSLNSGETSATITFTSGAGTAVAAEFLDTPQGRIVQRNQAVNRGSTY